MIHRLSFTTAISYLHFMKYNLFLLISVLVVFTACENTTEDLVAESYKDYYPLQVGKFIAYRIDSTVFTKSGSMIETHKYQVKHTVHAETTDNQGRKVFLVNRLIRDEAGTSAWLENGSYIVTPLSDRVEVTENNMRVIKLIDPVKAGFSWRGNAYLPSSPFRPPYDMDAGSDMNEWVFSYTNFGDTTVNGQQYQNVWTVAQNNHVLNFPVTPDTRIALKEVGLEKYAKNIGLVYKVFDLYEYQGPHADNPQGTYTGFGITMWMIDHN